MKQLALMLLILFYGNLFAQNNVTLIGRWAMGDFVTIFVVGDYAYIGSGEAMNILDISNPASPLNVGQVITPENISKIYVVGNYAYVADEYSGLRIIDVSSPTSPQEVGFYVTGGRIRGVYVMGNYAYVAADYDGLRIIDVSSPTSPQEVGFHNTGGRAIGVYVEGNYAYVADDYDGLRIIDVSSPTSPQEVGFYDPATGDAHGVYVEGNFAYVADVYAGLRIIDVSSPTSPQEVGFYDPWTGTATDVYVIGNYAYLAADDIGLRIIDVSSPTSPQEVGFYYSDDAIGVYVVGNYAYVANADDGLYIIDVSSPTFPQEVGFYGGDDAIGVFVLGNYAYVANDIAGLRIIDVSSPASPQEVALYNIIGGDAAVNVYVVDNYAYVAADLAGLRIIDVSSPASPQEVGYIYTGLYAIDVHVVGNYAYVAAWADLRIIDVSSPTSPQTVGFYNTGGWAIGVYVEDNYAYVADGAGGLRIIDVSSPTSPQEVGFYDPGDDFATEVCVVGNYAYVTAWYTGLRIIDVSSPTSPQEVGFYYTGNLAEDVYVVGNYAYVADWVDGLYILQNDLITEPSQIAVTPVSIIETVAFEDSVDVEIEISNFGLGDLEWSAHLSFPSNFSYVQNKLPERSSETPSEDSTFEKRCSATKENKGSIQTIFNFDNQEIVEDGSFESGTPNPFWNENSTNFGTPLCDVPSCGTGGGTGPHTGNWWCWFGGTINAETGSIDQDISIPTGTATLTFWLEIPAGDTPGFMQVAMDGTTLFTVTEADLAAYSTYAEVILDISAYADGGIHNLKFFSTTNQGAITNFFVDDISIEVIPGEPWMTLLPPTSGTITSGNSEILTVRLSGIQADTTFTGEIRINSNDPVNSLIIVPVTLQVQGSTVIEEQDRLPAKISFSQNYPNPFNPATTITYTLSKTCKVVLKVYNSLGQEIRKLVNGTQPMGIHSVVWDGKDEFGNSVGSGTYVYQIQVRNEIRSKKMLLIK